jgi:sugar transferase (PEP-CTERM/EpsH1 system associated)
MSPDKYRHVVISLTEATDFKLRIVRDDVAFIELHKTPGHGLKVFPRLLRLFRTLRPAIVHTRNLAALEATFPAWLAGVPIRVHGEHGRDTRDLDGSNRNYRIVRRAYRPFVTQYIALSRDLERYLVEAIGVGPPRVAHIVNGVDTKKFSPAPTRQPFQGCPFLGSGLVICGTVGRLQSVKNQVLLAKAFVRALEENPALRARLRLVIIGEGPSRAEIDDILRRAGVDNLAWLPGMRNDVADALRTMDIFVMPSLAEGMSNTVLEAMASGLPVIATRVGGNVELIDDGVTGALVPSGEVDALAHAIVRFARERDLARVMGLAGRLRVEQRYSVDAMVAEYSNLYDRLLTGGRGSWSGFRGTVHARTMTGDT